MEIKEIIEIINRLNKNKIGNLSYDYYFLKNLDKKEYPLYLAKLFYMKTGEKLPLSKKLKIENGKLEINYEIDKKKCKTFNQKIQWIKLYGITDLMRKYTDKVLVRDYVKEKIGSEYLKPVLQVIPSLNCDCHVIARNNNTLGDEAIQGKRSQKAVYENSEIKSNNNIGWTATDYRPRSDRQLNDVSTYFDQIDFDKLPNSFIIKCSHGCKWHFIIKNKEAFLQNERLFDIVKKNITGWLEQDYSFWNGFEMQYHFIRPKILIEPFLQENANQSPIEINVYCFKGIPKIIIKFFDNGKMSIWNENFEPMENIFNFSEQNLKFKIDDYINQAFDLSIKLSKNFDFVRVDWMPYKNKLYFEELTFTPYSGFLRLKNNKNLTKIINSD